MKSGRWFGLAIIVCAVLFVVTQIAIVLQYEQMYRDAVRAVISSKTPGDARTVEQAVALRIANQSRTMFLSTIATNMGAALGIIVAASGIWLSLQQYLGTRERERSDRAAAELNDLWKGVPSSSASTVAASAAGLQSFLSRDRREHHERVAVALAIIGRTATEDVVVRTLTPVVEHAFRTIDPAITRRVSWQGVRLYKPDLRNCDLSRFDFRDAQLEEADLRGANLAGARLDAARLMGARMDGADFTGASLEYVDMARATALNTCFRRANLRHLRLLNADFNGATLNEALLTPDRTDFRLSRNWRLASLDASVRLQLEGRYGPAVSGVRVLMLMWEFPPFVTGGGWTAASNIVSRLRRKGHAITVVVPWHSTTIDQTIFGNDVPVVGVGFGGERDEAGFIAVSAYSAYQKPREIGTGRRGGYGGFEGESIAALASRFALNVLPALRHLGVEFDLVHCHDWLTAEAGIRLADTQGTPLVVHLHSLESDRRLSPNRRIMRVEAEACAHADAVIAVSSKTKADIVANYSQVDPERIAIISNPIDLAPRPRVGEHQTQRVVFLGRLAWQKGVDRFVQIAADVRKLRPQTVFDIVGEGEDAPEVARQIEVIAPPPDYVYDPVTTDDYSLRRLFAAARATSYDPAARRIQARGRMFGETQLENLGRTAGRMGFSLTPVQGWPPFTHRLSYGQPGSEQYYLVQTTLAGAYADLSTRFITLTGWQEGSEAMNGATILVVPSRNEPFGMVVPEAMLSGVAVLVSRDVGATDVFKSILTFDPDDLSSAVMSVTKVLNDEQYWLETVERQSDEVRRYGDSAVEDQITRVWAAVIANRRVPSVSLPPDLTSTS
jgi:glycogen(starch) synthase